MNPLTIEQFNPRRTTRRQTKSQIKEVAPRAFSYPNEQWCNLAQTPGTIVSYHFVVDVELIQSLGANRPRLKKPIGAKIDEIEPGNYIASVPEAEIFAAGDTRNESIENLKDIIAVQFSYFNNLPDCELGPILRRQLAFLKQHIQH